MLILAVETSAKPVSVAVYDTGGEGMDCNVSRNDGSGKLLGMYFQNNGFSHSRTMMCLVQSLLENLELKLSDIDLISVASGPGSFTGVRIGVSAVKGLAFGLEIPVCGVSTLEAMARQTDIKNVLLCPVMDARREQVYNALFEWDDGNFKRLCPDRAISIADLAADINTYNKPCLLIGDGADVCYSGFSALSSASPDNTSPDNASINFEFNIAPQLLRYQTAHGVALAALHAKQVPPAELEPFYLRPSQAERMLKEKN